MKLYLDTVSNLLWNTLQELMLIDDFKSFRLVGGTSLSLQLGHRESVDIDMFTDSEYGSIDFAQLETILRAKFAYIDAFQGDLVGMGKSFFIGHNSSELVKLDLFYTDTYAFPLIEVDGVRLASVEDIVAMKLDVIGRGGRKKDFWDLHQLLEKYSIDEMIEFYTKRYPYNHSREELIASLSNFDIAENDFTPICYKDKIWEIIKLDFEEITKMIRPKG